MSSESSASVTHIRVDRADDRLAQLSHDERMRLIVRVLCELVAYGEPDVQVEDAMTPVADIDRVAS